jgi:Ca-activated chloride channel homolog
MENEYLTPWYYLDWFSPSTWQSFTWDSIWYLYLALAVPILFVLRWLLANRFSQKLPVAFTERELKKTPVNLVRLVPEVLLLVSLALIFVALARPQRSNERQENYTQGIDIMLGLDVSPSMQFEDFDPNRLEAAKNVALDFINGRKNDRIGIVVFSGEAFSLSPLTTDYELLTDMIRDVNFDMMQTRGTAIGSAMGVITNRMRESTARSKVCIIISDGENNAGNIDPITAAELGAAYGVTIYTILVGREGLVPFGKDFFGNPRLEENTVDETTLRRMAEIGKGEFFRAEDRSALEKVFQTIDNYEKAEIKEVRYRETSDYYFIYLNWAVCFFLLWLLTKSTFLNNILQD